MKLVLLHGRGDNEQGLLPVAQDLSQRLNATVDAYSIRSRIPMGGGGFCWFQGTSGNPEPTFEAEIYDSLK